METKITQPQDQNTDFTEVDVYRARVEGRIDELLSGREYRLIDLFSGAGGLSAGFTRFEGHQFEPVWANDFNDYAIATYNRNFGDHGVGGDILTILEDASFVVPHADVVVGGPPCQGFSLRDGERPATHWLARARGHSARGRASRV